jgi:RNA polymerase primary sigma factor
MQARAQAPRSRPSPDELARLVDEGRDLVPAVARRYVGLGLPFDDLMGAGQLGVVRAAHRFDPERGVKFVSYAAWWVRKEISSALEQSHLVPVPRHTMKRRRRILDAEGPAARDRLGLSPVQIRHALQAWAGPTVPLEPVADYLVDRREPGPETRFLENERTRRLRAALDALSPKERFVLDRRFGLNGSGGSPTSLDALGCALGISGERVRQIEASALNRIRRALRPGRRPSSSPTRS